METYAEELIAYHYDTCAECGEIATELHDLRQCANCKNDVELCGEGGFIYPDGSILCPKCEEEN